jgi:hypothetical protein
MLEGMNLRNIKKIQVVYKVICYALYTYLFFLRFFSFRILFLCHFHLICFFFFHLRELRFIFYPRQICFLIFIFLKKFKCSVRDFREIFFSKISFEPGSRPRKGRMIGRTTPTEHSSGLAGNFKS